jgi:hypothetical protein
MRLSQARTVLSHSRAAVNGRTSEYFDRKLFKAEVALREGVVARTIERNVAAGTRSLGRTREGHMRLPATGALPGITPLQESVRTKACNIREP